MTPQVGWLALLPAAKTTRPGGEGPPWGQVLDRDPLLAEARRAVRDALTTAAGRSDASSWETLVDGRGELAEAARDAARSLDQAPTRPAGERYAGPVADRLDAATIPASGRRHLAIVTATGGPVLVDDLVPDERLPVGSRLEPLGVLATFWRPTVAGWLDARLTTGAVVYDLLGGEYARAVAVPDDRRRIEVRFERTDGRAAPSATAKQLRGLAARHLATASSSPIEPAAALAGLDVEVAGERWLGPGTLADDRLTLHPA